MIDHEAVPELNEVRIVVHPAPTRDEAAAIVAALRARQRRRPAHPESKRSAWRIAARGAALRTELSAEPGGWAQSARLNE